MFAILIINLITALQIFFAALSVHLFLQGKWSWALVLFAACVASDAIDGKLARQFDCVSRAGTTWHRISNFLVCLIYVIGGVWCLCLSIYRHYPRVAANNPEDAGLMASMVGVLVIFACVMLYSTDEIRQYLKHHHGRRIFLVIIGVLIALMAMPK